MNAAFVNNDKLIFRLVSGISIFVFIVVVLLNRRVIPVTIATPEIVYIFPAINALINASCSVLLLTSLYFIRKKNILMHKRLNLITFTLSSIFLVLYIVYHYFATHTSYPADSSYRNIYLTILYTHIILAAGVLPLILLSFHRGLQMQVEKHRKLVRFAFPIWLYVTVTGVIVYLMISPFYTH